MSKQAQRWLVIYMALPLLAVLVFVYPWLRITTWLNIVPQPSYLYFLLLWVLPPLSFIIWARSNNPHRYILGLTTLNWMGVCIMFVWAVLIVDALSFFTSINTTYLALLSIIIGICICLFSIISASRFKLTHLSLSSKKLDNSHKIVHLSDIHFGSRSKYFIDRIIKKTNSINPDFVVITGDLIDMSYIKPDMLSRLENFATPVYFVTGNHDRYLATENHFNAIKNAGVKILDNKMDYFKEIQIIGVEDTIDNNRLKATLPKINKNNRAYSILLYHKPEHWDIAADHDIDLMLSGHTHKGQIFPFNYVVKQYFPKYYGLHKINKLHLFITSGTGTWGPIMRLGSTNEIAVIQLKALRGD